MLWPRPRLPLRPLHPLRALPTFRPVRLLVHTEDLGFFLELLQFIQSKLDFLLDSFDGDLQVACLIQNIFGEDKTLGLHFAQSHDEDDLFLEAHLPVSDLHLPDPLRFVLKCNHSFAQVDIGDSICDESAMATGEDLPLREVLTPLKGGLLTPLKGGG